MTADEQERRSPGEHCNDPADARRSPASVRASCLTLTFMTLSVGSSENSSFCPSSFLMWICMLAGLGGRGLSREWKERGALACFCWSEPTRFVSASVPLVLSSSLLCCSATPSLTSSLPHAVWSILCSLLLFFSPTRCKQFETARDKKKGEGSSSSSSSRSVAQSSRATTEEHWATSESVAGASFSRLPSLNSRWPASLAERAADRQTQQRSCKQPRKKERRESTREALASQLIAPDSCRAATTGRARASRDRCPSSTLQVEAGASCVEEHWRAELQCVGFRECDSLRNTVWCIEGAHREQNSARGGVETQRIAGATANQPTHLACEFVSVATDLSALPFSSLSFALSFASRLLHSPPSSCSVRVRPARRCRDVCAGQTHRSHWSALLSADDSSAHIRVITQRSLVCAHRTRESRVECTQTSAQVGARTG